LTAEHMNDRRSLRQEQPYRGS